MNTKRINIEQHLLSIFKERETDLMIRAINRENTTCKQFIMVLDIGATITYSTDENRFIEIYYHYDIQGTIKL